jgi:MFS family permease
MMHAFRTIFAHPGAPGMVAAAFVGRFPMAIVGLALTLLVVAETGSYAQAGAVGAAVTLASAVGGPLSARLADRHGQHRVLPPLLGVHVTAVTLLTVAVMAGTPLPLWLALGALAGLTGPNIGAMVRARWAGVAQGPDELSTAFALESTLDEVAFVLGPPLATALAVVVAPWSALAAGMALALAGGLALAAQRSTEPPAAPRSAQAGPPIWRSGTLQLLTLLMVLMGAAFGALEVSTVAFAQEAGSVGTTGWLLGTFALASGLTGLFLGARPGLWPLPRQVLVGTAMLAVATAALPFIGGVGWYAAGMFGAGLGVSAVMIGALQVIERVMPRARLTESLALAIAGVLVGSSAAIALSGALIDRGGSAWGLAVGSVAALLAVLLVLAAGRHLGRALRVTVEPATVDLGAVDAALVEPGTVEPGTVERAVGDPTTADPLRSLPASPDAVRPVPAAAPAGSAGGTAPPA